MRQDIDAKKIHIDIITVLFKRYRLGFEIRFLNYIPLI